MGIGPLFEKKPSSFDAGNIARREAATRETQRVAALNNKRSTIQAARDRIMAAPAGQRLQAEQFKGEELPAGPLKQFDVMRQRVQQRQNAAGQTQQDAMRRRLAAAGTLDSGAGIKALAVAEQDNNMQAEDAVMGVEAEEAAARAQMEEAVKQRNFQGSQAMEQRNLARVQFNEDAAFREKSFQADAFAKFQDMEMQIEHLDLAQIQQKVEQEKFAYERRLAIWDANNNGLFGIGNDEFEG